MKLNRSWISEHPRLVIGVILFGCLGPFINKAIHVDDPIFVWTGQWIQKHPIDFFGCKLNWVLSTVPMWVENRNPPLMSYFLAGVASLFGWHEIVLHLACLAVAFMAAIGIYALAEMWCERPLLATVVAIFTPVFLVSSTTLMCDVLMLAFWVWAFVLWERALASEKCWWRFAGGGMLAGLAVLTKYSAVTLLPLLTVLSLIRIRKPGWWLLGLAVSLAMVAGYEWLTTEMYGRGLLFSTVGYVQTAGLGYSGDWKGTGVIVLAFTGGSLLPLLFFAPLLWRRWALLAIGAGILGTLLAVCYFGGDLRLIFSWGNPGLTNRWDFLLQVGVLTMAGVHLLFLIGAEAWQRRNIVSTMLVLWISSELFFWTVLNHHLGARRFLPIVPAAAILLVRRLTAIQGNVVTWRLLWPLLPAAAITWSVAMADYQLAKSAKIAAEQITAKYKSANRQLWFEGHWGFQYYMEKLGAKPIDVERSALAPGDIVVVPWINYGFIPLPAGSVTLVEVLEYRPYSWMNLLGGTENQAAGFYAAYLGPVPFAIGKLPSQPYFVVRVCSSVQFNTQPTNPQQVLAGDAPVFSRLSQKNGDPYFTSEKPEVKSQVELAHQLEGEGKTETAIRHYRQALQLDPNDPIALNDLAWALTMAGKFELRNGEEAVHLAEKAVILTHASEPVIIGTLAAAYAQTGQFSKAVEMANIARNLALVTGQREVAAKNSELLTLYSSHKTVGATQDPY